jgi:hypothetical protein
MEAERLVFLVLLVMLGQEVEIMMQRQPIEQLVVVVVLGQLVLALLQMVWEELVELDHQLLVFGALRQVLANHLAV